MGNSALRCECQDDVRTRGNTKPDAWGRQVSEEEDTVAMASAGSPVVARSSKLGLGEKGGGDDQDGNVWSHAEEGPEPEPPRPETPADEDEDEDEDEPRLPAAGAGVPKSPNGRALPARAPRSTETPHDRHKVIEDQCNKLVNANGFFVALDPTGSFVPDVLERYGHQGMEAATADELEQLLCSLRERVAKDEAFDGSRILGAVVCQESLACSIDGMPLPAYLWWVKQVVPILRISHGLGPMKKGVQLMEVPDNADDVLDTAVKAQVFAVKTRCTIGGADRKGIRSAVKQQFEFARRVIQKGLAACLQVEVKPDASEKEACERLLADVMLEALGELQAEEKVILDLSIPEEPNIFLPLIGHPCTMRVTGLSGGYGLAEACRTLEMNVSMVASFGRAFLESIHLNQSPEEFTKALRATCDAMYQASMAVPTKEVQVIKVETSDGFFVALDQTASHNDPILQRYGVPVETLDKAELARKLHQMRSRVFTDAKFNGSRVIATTLSEDSMGRKVSGMPTAKYLWQVKHVVPFLRVDRQHGKETNGVRLINVDTSKLDKLLEKACSAGMFGTKARSSIRLANAAGIKAVVDQQFEIASKVLAKGLVPILMPEVDISSPDKGACEELLLDALMAGLQKLRSDEKVILWLTLPTKSNQYFPLIHHPNAIRLVALSGGYNRGESCQMLKQNCGMVAGFGRAFTEEMRHSMSDKDFSKVLDEACEQVFKVSKRPPVKQEQSVKVGGQEGFFVALDQTGKNTKRILESYGWWSSELDNDLQAKLHAFRTRVFTHPRFNGSRVIGVLLSTDTMDREIAQMPTPQYLWEQKKVVPFLRVDRGLLDEADGVQLMRDIKGLDAIIEKAAQVGFFGTKHRNVILHPNATGIKHAVEQQFEVAKMSLKAGLVPILHIEVDINSPDKADSERILRQSLMSGLRTIDTKEKVVLLLSIPTKADTYRPLIGHAQVLRVLASSGGYQREEACDKLLENVGLVASFGRAFLDGMSRKQTDNEFARAMDESCDAIFQASRQRADTFGAAGGGADGGPARTASSNLLHVGGQARKSGGTRSERQGDEAPAPSPRSGSKKAPDAPRKAGGAPAPKRRGSKGTAGTDGGADTSATPEDEDSST